MHNKKAFSFVELIIVISIITLISIIGISINNNYTERSKNSKITSDIQTLQNSLEAYKSETKTLPDPKGNQRFFDDSSNYVHYDDPTAFGVSGFITEDTIPKKYLGYLPIDPRTEQYYAYGKTLTGAIEFEIAGVNVKDGVYESKVVGDYTGESGPYNLIREYNGPDFVYDFSKNNFPYNPDERVIRCKIGSMSGSVKVNDVVVDANWIANNELKAPDTIEVGTGGEAQIYYSDGSKSYLGDPTKASKLTLANMVYKDKNNLFTKIQLTLDYGTIWTKTSKLDLNSEFEIYTVDTEAVVRGTIFGVSSSSSTGSTTVSVQTGIVDVKKIATITMTNIKNKLEKNEIIGTVSFSIGTLPLMVSSRTITSGSGITFFTSIQETSSIIVPPLPEYVSLSNTQPKIKSIIPGGTVVLELPSSFSGAGMRIISGESTDITSSGTWNDNILTLTGLTGTKKIKICDFSILDNCTKSVTVTTTLAYSSKCKLGELYFGSGGCTDQDPSLVASGYTLVAYAPYDVAGDLNMYRQDGYTITKSSSGTTFDDSNPNNKGIKIMSGSYDCLAYSGNELGVGSNFAVEMNVRGGALKRSGNFYLFNDRLSNIRAYKQSSILKYFLDGTNSNYINTFSDLNSSNFYKTIFKKDGLNQYMDIRDLNTNYYNSFTSASNITLSSDLYIGSSKFSGDQWNDFIDYVKIYKK